MLSRAVFHSVLEVFKASSNLHKLNQEKIAEYIFQQVQRDATSDLLLQFMIEMFSLQESAVLCLHLQGPEETTFHPLPMNRTESVPKKRGLRFDPEYCDPHIELSEDLLTATCTTTTKWCTVLAAEPLSPGLHKWDVVINKCTSTCNIMVGVCERNQNLTFYVGQDTNALGRCMSLVC